MLIPRTPRATLFPYTTLFRSYRDCESRIGLVASTHDRCHAQPGFERSEILGQQLGASQGSCATIQTDGQISCSRQCQIGRASCRERVEISVVAVVVKIKGKRV